MEAAKEFAAGLFVIIFLVIFLVILTPIWLGVAGVRYVRELGREFLEQARK